MKKNIIQTLKIITAGFILSAGFAMAQTWIAAPTTPLTTNSSAPINVGAAQSKTGALATGPLAVFGNSSLYDATTIGFYGTNNLSVSGSIGIGVTSPTEKVDVAGNVKVSSLASGGNVCVDVNGTFVLCPPVTPPPPPVFSLSYQTASVTTLGGTGCSPYTYQFTLIPSNAAGSVNYTETQNLTYAAPTTYNSSFNISGTAGSPVVVVHGYLTQTGAPTTNSKEVLNITGTDQAGHVANSSIVINGFKAPKYASNGSSCPL